MLTEYINVLNKLIVNRGWSLLKLQLEVHRKNFAERSKILDTDLKIILLEP